MNERIDELAFAAGCHRHKYWDPKHPDLEGFIINQAALDKFAELIVWECLEKIYSVTIDNPTDDWDQGYDSGLDQAAETIKTHFGVEE